MKKEEIICLLVRKALFADYSEESNNRVDDAILNLSDDDWMEVYHELVAQTIEGLPYEWVLEQVSVPDNVRSRWEQSRINQVANYYWLLQAQSELCQLMKDHGIPMVIMKGTAAAMYYPDPSARTMGDIDFLVAKSDYQRAFQLMKEHGYQSTDEKNAVEHHFDLEKDGFIFELHYKPVGMRDVTEFDYLMGLLEDGLQKAEQIELEPYSMPVFPDMQNGLILLLHIVRHLKNGLGLRQIIDWMMYVHRSLHDDNWYGNMQPVFEKLGLETMAKSVTKMCQMYLGLGEEEITWCADADYTVCRELMCYIMQQGNFGRKVASEDRSVRIFGQVHGPIQFFQLLQKNGQRMWKASKDYPALKRVAWVYMLCRYIKKYIQSRGSIKTLFSNVKSGHELRNLFDRLEIYNK